MAGPAGRVGTLAVIGTFYRRPALYPMILDAIAKQTRPPDELWLMCEEQSDLTTITPLAWTLKFPAYIRWVTIPRDEGGRPLAIPPSVAINAALDVTGADYITYLTDDSLPHPDKYARMVEALDAGARAVYVSQGYGKCPVEEWPERILRPDSIRTASGPQSDPFCAVDHTQVAHVRTEDRWPLAMGDLSWSDGAFFRDLVARLGPLQPIPEVLDFTCQMPDGISART